MTLITNTLLHTRTAIIVNPFGADGAIHVTALDGERERGSGAFILDRAAARTLAALILDHARDED